MIAAGFVGTLLALAAAFAIEAADRRLRSVDDVEAAFAVPVLGCLPGRSTYEGATRRSSTRTPT